MSTDDPGKSNYIKPSKFPGRTDKYDLTISPTPQPSGRMILSKLRANAITRLEAQRQLFNAICSEVIGSDDSDQAAKDFHDLELAYDIESRNRLRAELKQRLRVFFGQAEASGKEELQYHDYATDPPDDSDDSPSVIPDSMAAPPQPEANGNDGDE